MPPWLAWGALATTGAYTWEEVGGMALPLAAAAFVEHRRLDLHRFRRPLEVAALAVFLFLVAARTGVLPTVVNTLFMLCGVRLALPRGLPQRRQVLLMGFLLFLTTAVSTSDLDFLLWAVLWAAGAAAALVQQAWDQASERVATPAGPAPLGRVPRWTVAAVVVAAGCFVILPRLRAGVRGLPLGLQTPVGGQAGLPTVLDLSARGPLEGGTEVALRVVPGQPDPGLAGPFGLLKALVLEDLRDQRWERAADTPRRFSVGWRGPVPPDRPLEATLYVNPAPVQALPLPYGFQALEPPDGETLRPGPGGALRWTVPVRRILPLRVQLHPLPGEPERGMTAQRLADLTAAGDQAGAALRFSRREAPGDLPPAELAARLTTALRAFRYTLDNPSGGAARPVDDFLERTRAGHCEYFASALALMLRARGVAARVAVGYRLGPWIPEGGYWLVTQNEAHSWVEFYDPEARLWRIADPTPPAPPSAFGAGGVAAAAARMADALRFRWDRYVVRFSDEDQVQGLAWLQDGWDRLRLGPGLGALLKAAALVGAAGALAWAAWRFFARGGAGDGLPGRITELAPLVRAAGTPSEPFTGETARAWLARLALLRPDRAPALAALAQEADAVTYGGKGRAALARLAQTEAAAWRIGDPAPRVGS
ncbi:transglutaminaseTgpA domain-containing protein [Mesoterricola sediminis]|uniref:transglutaminaseTgpA domain-containing protein n=1 Tax=Mesoterricola sediminis TaxID=2927980 RepID=UPI0027E37928|nr:transglutaminaseTgpA domain-containing protein [Mesoterricola sediminis]